MKRIIFLMICLVMGSMSYQAEAQKPKDYKEKTVKLADEFVKHSKEGNYNKTYKALRNIQKYEFRLQKEELVSFYTDIHKAVDEACEKYGIDETGHQELQVVIDALFSDELKEAVQK